MNTVIKLNKVTKTFNVGTQREGFRSFIQTIFNVGNRKKIKAIDNVDFEINKGEIFGIIGSNGSGKSTLLNLIIGNYRPDKGSSIEVNGRILRLTLGMGVDLNLSGRENIYINGSMIGLTFKQISEKYDEIIDFADLREFENMAVKYYSKGMKSRLLFSIAINANADIFLLDEFFGGVGDENFKAKSNAMFKENITKKNTIVIVTHQMRLIKEYCNRALWLDKGQIKMIGDPQSVVKSYKEFMAKKKV